jgi:hypothetical protein
VFDFRELSSSLPASVKTAKLDSHVIYLLDHHPCKEVPQRTMELGYCAIEVNWPELFTLEKASIEWRYGHQTRAKVPKTTRPSFDTSRTGFRRLRHLPKRWLKNAGAKYAVICSKTTMKHSEDKSGCRSEAQKRQIHD